MFYDNTQAMVRRLFTAWQQPIEWLNIPPGGIALWTSAAAPAASPRRWPALQTARDRVCNGVPNADLEDLLLFDDLLGIADPNAPHQYVCMSCADDAGALVPVRRMRSFSVWPE